MATKHKVAPGDWIGAIARRYGLPHWSEIWDHPENEEIRQRRETPDLLLTNDEIHIPASDDAAGIEAPTNHRLTFVVQDHDVLRLGIIGIESFIEAFGPIPYELQVGSEQRAGELTEEGQELALPLRTTATQAVLTLFGKDAYHFLVGGLGPVDAREGAHARLLNLGYKSPFVPSSPAGELEGAEATRDPVAEALQAFQSLNGLPPTGELDPETTNLVRSHYDDFEPSKS